MVFVFWASWVRLLVELDDCQQSIFVDFIELLMLCRVLFLRCRYLFYSIVWFIFVMEISLWCSRVVHFCDVDIDLSVGRRKLRADKNVTSLTLSSTNFITFSPSSLSLSSLSPSPFLPSPFPSRSPEWLSFCLLLLQLFLRVVVVEAASSY